MIDNVSLLRKAYTSNLTKNGNEYTPVRTGAAAGTIAGALGAYKLYTDVFLKVNSGLIDNIKNAKGFKENFKSIGKASGFALLSAAVLTGTIKLGKLLGNTLFDAPKNQELRDQADGREVLKAYVYNASEMNSEINN